MLPYFLLGTVLLALAAGGTSGSNGVCTSNFETIVSDDCKTLHRCVWGKPVKMPDCTPGLIYSREYGVCVYEGSEFDDCGGKKATDGPCTSKPCHHAGGCKASDDGKSFTCTCPAEYGGATCEKALTIEEICSTQSYYRAPHPRYCQLYYDCASSTPDSVFLKQHEVECEYPKLFSEETLRCENYTEVNCGDRTEYKSACQYFSHQCGGSHCAPCALYYPSCEGKQDGVHPHGYKTDSPWFMVCKDERFVSDGLCPSDPYLRVASKIYKGECTSVYGIPKDQGGIMPDCAGVPDGSYTLEEQESGIYFRCDSGKATVLRCPPGEMFDEGVNSCKGK